MIATRKVKIGLVGCGAIGSSLAKEVITRFSAVAVLAGVYDIDGLKAKFLAKTCGSARLATDTLDELINRSDLVIEAACAHAARIIARKVLAQAKDVMVMSVGGILRHYPQLAIMAKRQGRHIVIPSGAVAGIDGLKAVSCGRIKKVILTTTKPLRSFRGNAYITKKKINLASLKKRRVIFQGNALQAVTAFPQNINVAATVSIAGIGPEKTVVRIVASPQAKRNIHELEIVSDMGRIVTSCENAIHPNNPKTSFLAVLSAIATLKTILEPIRIGT